MDLNSRSGNQKKGEARKCYQERAAAGTLQLPSKLKLDPDLGAPPLRYWLAIEIKFNLLSSWYSKDDRVFHVLDNPVRKDRVFGVPYMSAASWKGLLRWACRMQAGLQEHLQRHGGKMDDWSDPDWILHLFGNEKGEKEDFLRGALAFYPSWFAKVGFEVINPHSRKTRAGTQPILYEVVPANTEGVLRLLYAPLPGDDGLGAARRIDALQKLLDAAEQLLTVYGFSAKRTAGWGIAEVIATRANGGEWKQENRLQELKGHLATLLSSEVDQR
jgi:CRISPR-associated protein Cmr2